MLFIPQLIGWGGNPPSTFEIKDFSKCIDEIQVYPLTTVSGSFTWSNRDGIMSKIDHIFGNALQKDKFYDCSVTYFPGGLFDHSAINLYTSNVLMHRRVPFKLFNHLLDHPNFYTNLVNSWCTPTSYKGVGSVWDKLKAVKKCLKELYLVDHTKISHKVDNQHSILLETQSSIISSSGDLLPVEKNQKPQFKKWLLIENSILSQKSRIKQMKNFMSARDSSMLLLGRINCPT